MAATSAPMLAAAAWAWTASPTSIQGSSSRKACCNGRSTSVVCLASKRRGFGPEPERKNNNARAKEGMRVPSEPSKLPSIQPATRTGKAPGLAGSIDGRPNETLMDRQFMKRLEAVKRSVLDQKKAEEEKLAQEIDYEAPIDSDRSSVGIGTKVAIGIAVASLGLVFAFGDFLPSGSVKPVEESIVSEKRLSEEEKESLQTKLKQYQATLSISPNDLSALEGAAVTSSELGDFSQASSLLEKLTKERPRDLDAFRLLGEVKYELKDYEGSVAAYRNSLSVSETINFEVLRGFTNALLAAKKPDEV